MGQANDTLTRMQPKAREQSTSGCATVFWLFFLGAMLVFCGLPVLFVGVGVVGSFLPSSWTSQYREDPRPNYGRSDGEDGDGRGDPNPGDLGGSDEPCAGDCTDMDNDGRTNDDVDADGDGLYESRP